MPAVPLFGLAYDLELTWSVHGEDGGGGGGGGTPPAAPGHVALVGLLPWDPSGRVQTIGTIAEQC